MSVFQRLAIHNSLFTIVHSRPPPAACPTVGRPGFDRRVERPPREPRGRALPPSGEFRASVPAIPEGSIAFPLGTAGRTDRPPPCRASFRKERGARRSRRATGTARRPRTNPAHATRGIARPFSRQEAGRQPSCRALRQRRPRRRSPARRAMRPAREAARPGRPGKATRNRQGLPPSRADRRGSHLSASLRLGRIRSRPVV
jgi:hypothetical protein